jgi:hypothetical protein
MNYQLLLNDCKEIIVEYGFTSRWAVIEGYHALGKRIAEEKIDNVTVTQLANDLDKPVRTFQRSLQFYKKYPDLLMLPEGKNTSWHQIVNKYLPETVAPKEKKLTKCPKCGFEF